MDIGGVVDLPHLYFCGGEFFFWVDWNKVRAFETAKEQFDSETVPTDRRDIIEYGTSLVFIKIVQNTTVSIFGTEVFLKPFFRNSDIGQENIFSRFEFCGDSNGLSKVNIYRLYREASPGVHHPVLW